MRRARFVAPVICIATGILVLLAATVAGGQTGGPTPSAADALICSPAPCVFPPTQASEGGAEVTDTPIAADPLSPLHLLLGSVDYNCPAPSISGFHISSNGGSTWARTCMPEINDFQGRQYDPGGEPMVGYDLNGTAYIADGYGDSEGVGYGLIGIQKSADGANWGQPAVALSEGLSVPLWASMAVDRNASSPYANSLYIAAVILGEPNQIRNQVVVSHSADGGTTWTSTNVAPVQQSPKLDRYTTLSIGADGAVYLTWMYCNLGFYFCDDGEIAYMVFTKSGDGGNTWSAPTLVSRVALGPGIPNSMVGADNYPAIGVDNSDGPYSGNLYVVMYNWTGTFMQVQVVHSSDGGNTWSKPVPVAPGITHDQFFPWLSVSSTGLVGVSWLDRRKDPAIIDYQAFAAISTDGGQSFQPNIQLTKKFSNPNNNGYQDNLWMGDYSGNTWDGPNYFIAAWMDSSNGVDMQEEVGGIRLK